MGFKVTRSPSKTTQAHKKRMSNTNSSRYKKKLNTIRNASARAGAYRRGK
jgi:hypothetical protein